MRLRSFALVAALTAGVWIAPPRRAEACGGCFVSPSETTQVTGHKMVLSVSQTQTTLYDQITYSGDPEEFAWVLPIRGEVDIALSSDALFQMLETNTAVQIFAPQTSCPSGGCPSENGGFLGAGGASSDGSDPDVEILAEEVVGPYDTVQLSSDDPAALTQWLDDHGYSIPADLQPVIDDYVAEGFDFLALRLVPGEGVAAMRPVAITTPGAGPALPLRMVAAGTGAVTPITLWVIGEGRYEPQNFPSFLLRESDLVWNWDEQRSNYSELKQQQFDRLDGHGWLVEAAEPLSPFAFDQLLYVASTDPEGSGYADADGQNAFANAEADLALLVEGTDPASRWITRLSANLTRPALTDDLLLQASGNQSTVNRSLFITNAIGTVPPCPPPPVCGDSGSGANGSGGGEIAPGGGVDRCSANTSALAPRGIATVGLVGVLLGLAGLRRRRRPTK